MSKELTQRLAQVLQQDILTCSLFTVCMPARVYIRATTRPGDASNVNSHGIILFRDECAHTHTLETCALVSGCIFVNWNDWQDLPRKSLYIVCTLLLFS